MRPSERRRYRRLRALETRLRAVEDVLTPTTFDGPVLSAESLKDGYAWLRAQAVRQVVLYVHPGMAGAAVELAAETNLRALQRVEVDETLPLRGWKLAPAESGPAGFRRVGD